MESQKDEVIKSSSSRTTWIEIHYTVEKAFDDLVVLLAEDVDRNTSV